MLAAQKKIKKQAGVQPSELEQRVAQALFDLEVNEGDISADLKDLYIQSAQEVAVKGGKPAVVLFVPHRLHTQFRKIQTTLIRELEKKFSGQTVTIVASRKILPVTSRVAGYGQERRARKFTLTNVHNAVLGDLLFPAEVVGRRTRVKLDGAVQKVLLDKKDQANLEGKLDAFSTVYNKLTGKSVAFEFPQGN